jgi:hypothetical protein
MFESIVSLGVAALTSLFTPAGSQEIKGPSTAIYECGQVEWKEAPQMVDGEFRGQLQVTCDLTPTKGGDYASLKEFTTQPLKRGTIHSGPVSEIYRELPSDRYDVTIEVGGKDSARVRQDVHLATDMGTRYLMHSFSKSIQGTGNAKYLKRVDTQVEVSKNPAKAGSYRVQMSGVTYVEQPWFAPEEMFYNELKTRLPQELAKVRDRMIQEIDAHF